MDAYNILLGRLWQFDWCLMQDGRKNIHSIMKDGKHIQQLLLEDEEQCEVLLVMIKEFVSAIKETKDYYVVVQRKVSRHVKKQLDMKKIARHAMKESEDEVECSRKNEFLYESKNLLEEFIDVA